MKKKRRQKKLIMFTSLLALGAFLFFFFSNQVIQQRIKEHISPSAELQKAEYERNKQAAKVRYGASKAQTSSEVNEVDDDEEIEQLASTTTQAKKVIKYKVQPGDSLTMIAEKYNTTVEQIMQDNNLMDGNVASGVTLTIKRH